MKVILLQDVSKVGRRHEVKETADGFGRNYLIARGLAILANTKNLKKLDSMKQHQGEADKVQQDLLDKALAGLADKALDYSAKANDEGHLFAGIHQNDIVAALEKERGLKLSPEAIQLDEPIKTLGEHTIEIKTDQSSGQFTLRVIAA
ncbi:MAG: 50S ribosomal protein L9 [Patescibacteria group bacterium]|nr:50S ribosomal protein L9 [Patescibacteria group bacterium]